MILLLKATANNVIVTVSEKTTLPAPVYYLFEFISDTGNNAYYCIATDTGAFPTRYNQFTITEQASPNPLLGQISLSESAGYHYNIYQQASSTNLNPANASGAVESGKAFVQVLNPTDIDYIGNTPNTPDTIVYEG